MTKNHILIKSIALGVLLTLSSPVKAAGGVDEVLVAYFNKLYMGASPKCNVDKVAKTKILAELEPKCLIRTVKDEGAFISGVKSACTEASVKTAVDAQVSSMCENPAAKADQVAIQKQQEAAKQQEQKQQQQASGNNTAASALQQAAKGMQLFSDISNKKLRKEEKEKEEKTNAGGGSTPAATPTASADPKSNGSSANTVSPGSGPGGWSTGAANTANTETPAVDKAPGSASPIASPDLTTQVQKAETDKVLPETEQSVENLSKTPAGDTAKDTVAAAKPKETDPEYEARHAKGKAEDTALKTKIETFRTQLDAAKAQLIAETQAKCTKNAATAAETLGMTENPKMHAECMAAHPQTVINCLDTQLQQLEKDKVELQKDKEACTDNSAQAEKLCSFLRSDKAQTVQKLMSVGATVLSKVTAASESCGTTSDLSKVAQGGMLLAQGSCTAMKFRCDISCAGAKKTIEAMKTKVAAMKKCQASKLESAVVAGPKIDEDITSLEQLLGQELQPEKSVPSAIAQCIKHKADIALMGVAALGFLSAFQDAQECKKQLASGGGNTAGKSSSSLAGPSMTTAEYCSMPNNASSLTCKCTTDPSAEGCMGSIAKSGVNIGKIGNNGGASAFASAKQNGLGALNTSGKSGSGEELPPGANLSEAAREALGISAASIDGAGGPGAAGSAAGSAEAAKKAKDKEEEKPKFGFFSSLGNMISGGKKPDQAANATIRKHEQDQAIKRKLASDQVRAEISTASGKSNFDKIRSRYQQNAASFEQ